VGHHTYDLSERLPGEISIGPRAPGKAQEILLVPFLAGGLSDHLLGEHIQRLLRDHDPIELTAPHGVEEGGALYEVITTQRKEPALRSAPDRMAGPADPLQKSGDPPGRPDLAHEVDLPDVDPEFE
jgi:hypothetical protein